ncbi:MAG: hypothetical protein WD627_00165 [Actinomycetota bacterium]
MSARTVALLTLVFLSAVVACQPSQIDSQDQLTIAGKLLRQDGSPAPVGEVVLAPGFGGFGELLGGTFFTLISAGLVCLADSPPELCEVFRERAQTGEVRADGSFSLAARGSDTRTFFGNARPLTLTARLPEGQVIPAIFRVQTLQLELPELRFWEPEVKAGSGRVEWEALPDSGYGEGDGYQVLFEDGEGRQVWQFRSGGTQLAYDPRIVEDTRGGQTVVAQRKDVAPGTTLELAYRSAQVLFRGEGPPPSRGLPCSYQEEGSQPVTLDPSPLTHRDLFSAARLPDPRPGPLVEPGGTDPVPRTRSLIVDLGSVRNVSLVVLRGCSCTLAVSPDGRSWSELDSQTGDWSHPGSASLRARSVRVSGDIGLIREISIWS